MKRRQTRQNAPATPAGDPPVILRPSPPRITLVAMHRLLPTFCFGLMISGSLPLAWCQATDSSEIVAAESASSAAADADRIAFFESRIRPALIEHCLECHAADTDQQGGLLLDSRAGWMAGGDSGKVIVPGDADASRFLAVISGTDADLEMPPDGRLPASVIADFRRWIEQGAVDPRDGDESEMAKRRAAEIDWDAARQHWAYRPLTQPPVPTFAAGSELATWPRGPIDAFILAELKAREFQPSPRADRTTLLRRLSIDLRGVSPTPEEVLEFLAAEDDEAAYERIVDAWIASPDFARRFARHWMDVARYAESVTLRGLVQPEAWRYRDYLIDAIQRDRPWRELFREQIAGDLIEYDTVAQARDGQIAVTFLCMGDMNLENQQKRELEMDFIDEQLDTIGRGMLGQTLSCARCHDHKFDPIPTSDYYALAGILHGSVGIDHANVSRWIENPLPLEPAEADRYQRIAQESERIKTELASLKNKIEGVAPPPPTTVTSSSLPGIVVDNTQARRVGAWQESAHTKPFVDAGYLHDDNTGRGEKSLTFEPRDLPPGNYELRIAYCASSNRTSRALVTVFHADGETERVINQRTKPAIDGLWDSLGKFRFERGGQAFVMLSNDNADGHVIGDAVQFLPLDAPAAQPPEKGQLAQQPATDTEPDNEEAEQLAELERWMRTRQQLTARQAELQKELNNRPKAMGLRPRSGAGDLAVHIRGSIHQLGDPAPRGVLRVLAGDRATFELPDGSCGRLDLANWIASDDNPLTTRVFVNRVWLWVMGEGLVRTPDNFGTTGQAPTHPELLDWLTNQFIRDDWSLQRLVKQIAMSETYRQSSQPPSPGDPRVATDPDNRSWWRSDRKPLSAEALRDSVLAISGELEPTHGGSTIKPGTAVDYGYQHNELLRSIYLPVFRNALPELLETFNYADTGSVTGKRQRGIVAQQALAALNHPWFAERSRAAAEANRAKVGEDVADQVTHAFLQTLGRLPTTSELSATIDYHQAILSEMTAANGPDSPPARNGSDLASAEIATAALAEVYRGLFATAEFRWPD